MNKHSRYQVRRKSNLANEMFGIDAQVILGRQYFVYNYGYKSVLEGLKIYTTNNIALKMPLKVIS
jgi:hypothetical protein